MPRKKQVPKLTASANVDSYKHSDKRSRIPTQEESAKLPAKEKQPVKKQYAYDPSLDPQLVWSGKEEAGIEFGVSTVPIYVQEKIAPEAIIARLKQRALEDESLVQVPLFGDTAQQQFDKAVDFYKHEDNWQNRIILGDSLLVMNSLLEKEGLRGRVQTIYIDPPYGIKFGSNWQTSTKKRDVKDNKLDDLVRQPEQIKAFRDTWELGIHSYLSYLRDRLITARELLTESGSCFVQISDDNVHFIRAIMDEVFGPNNYVSEIFVKKTTGAGAPAELLSPPTVGDYVVWYAKDSTKKKYRKIFIEKEFGGEGASGYKKIELEDGSRMSLAEWQKQTGSEFSYNKMPKGAKIYALDNLTSQAGGETARFPILLNEKIFTIQRGSWKTNQKGIERLIQLRRLDSTDNNIGYIRYFEDFPYMPLTNLWTDTVGQNQFGGDKVYVVQTALSIVQRCILMSTDPGDIVLDPTCGSGTSAYVSEQWGRRWITIDTSRVALALAKTRIMTAKFPYYRLKDKNNIHLGFEYKTVPHVTLKSLANNEDPDQEVLHDQPYENKDTVRVSGPFTVESLSPHRISDQQEMLSSERFVETVIGNMLKSGVQTGDKNARVEFSNLDILPGGPEVQARGEYKTESGLKTAAVAIGPEFGSVDDDFVRDAARVAGKFADLLIVAATSFEAAAFAEPTEIEGLRIMKVKINPDLSMGDLLKKTGAGNLFLAFGEPDIKVSQLENGYTIEVLGVDVYDPVKSEIRSSGSGDPDNDIAAWFIDTNYNGESFFVTHAYFLGADKPYDKLKKALKADINEDLWEELYTTTSRPFAKPKTGKVAVKVINHFGDEVMKVVEIK